MAVLKLMKDLNQRLGQTIIDLADEAALQPGRTVDSAVDRIGKQWPTTISVSNNSRLKGIALPSGLGPPEANSFSNTCPTPLEGPSVSTRLSSIVIGVIGAAQLPLRPP